MWENFSVFSGLTRSFSWTHGSGACPAPASSTAFSGQRPRASRNSSVRMLALPQVKKTAESKVILQQTKGAFHLNRAAKTQMEPSLGHDILLCLLPLLPEGFLENELLGPVRILGPAALCPAGTAAAILTPVQGGGTQAVRPAPPLSPASDTASFPGRR